MEEQYKTGLKLYGDDFTLEQISKWYEDEKEAYSDFLNDYDYTYVYDYHALNSRLGFRFLPDKSFDSVMGMGSASGDEFLPILDRIKKLTIVEPSEKFWQGNIGSLKVDYISPNVSGKLPFPDKSFDLTTCFGVLHHIPNVSYVVSEMSRVLKDGGYLLIREPITSMGDWTKFRKDATKHERGIPINLLLNMIEKNKLEIIHRQMCTHPFTLRILRPFIKGPFYNSSLAVKFDEFLCKFFAISKKYYTESLIGKIRATSVFLVLKK